MNRLDWIEPSAKEMRSVNTIVVRGDELHGYNTDAAGFISPLRRAFGSMDKARCAIIGAGGAARAALWALNSEGAQVTLFARDPALAEYFARQFRAECKSLANASFTNFDVVINATPLGTRGELQNETPAAAKQLRGCGWLTISFTIHLRLDLFARRATQDARRSAESKMLLAQAVEQFKLWTGQTPDIEVIEPRRYPACNNRKVFQRPPKSGHCQDFTGVRVPTSVGLFMLQNKCPTKVGTLTPRARLEEFPNLNPS